MFDKKKKQNLKGFGLIEMILVMFIISFAFSSIYGVLSKVFEHEKDNRYSLIAANLAQEGVEIVRNKRDENLLKENPMNESLDEEECFPHWNGLEAECDSSKKEDVILDSDGIYRNCNASGCNSSDESTPFTRKCDISGDDEKLTVECIVEWKSPSLQIFKKIEIKSLLTNWQEN
jgi:prepilin-type N-terminal cleavage/methylation domain-containing protein